jgi:hypothetical protein
MRLLLKEGYYTEPCFIAMPNVEYESSLCACTLIGEVCSMSKKYLII